MHEFEKGLKWAAETGPEVWNEVVDNAKTKGYTNVRHYIECVTGYTRERIDGMLEGMGLTD